MKILKYISIICLGLLLADCSPKTAEQTKATGDQVKDMVEKTFRSSAPEAGPARKIELGKYDTFELPNGLKVIVVENRKLPRISYQLFVDKDYALEGDYAGLSSMAGQMLNKGTQKWTKAEIDEAVDYLGASLSTNAQGGFASSLTKHSDKLASIFAEVMLNPTFPQEEFEKLKTQTISGLQTEKDDPNAISRNVSSKMVYGDNHPYGEVTTEFTVGNITPDMVKDYYNTYFKPNASYLIVVGDINSAEAKNVVEKHFGSWEKGEVPTHDYDMPDAPGKTMVDFVDKAGAVQSVINVTYPINLKPGTEDVIPVRVLNDILGSGFSGRLFRNLREDKAYTYGAYSSMSSDELVGRFSAGASVRNEVTDSAVTEIIYELDKISKEPVSADELELAKNSIAGSFARGLESPNRVASFALNTYRYNLPKDYYNTYLEKLEKVTIDDVMRVAKKYVKPEKAHIVVVGNQDEVAEKLSKFDADGKVRFYDNTGKEKMAPSAPVGDMNAQDVISAYVKALGGKDKIDKIKTVKTVMSMNMMGTNVDVTVKVKPPMFNLQMNAQGMTMMKQVFNGEKALVEGMGQKQVLEGEDAASMANQGKIVPEMDYFNDGYQMELKGVEDVDGVSCYKLSVTSPDGSKMTEYYSVDSALKLKQISTTEQMGQKITVTNEYKEYKDVDGFMFPHLLKTSGASPVPMEMKVSKVEVNIDIPDSEFKIE